MKIKDFCENQGFTYRTSYGYFINVYNTHIEGVWISDEHEGEEIVTLFSKTNTFFISIDLLNYPNYIKQEIEKFNL
jgi:hypothetical protein